jgi:tRNA (guanine-N7-)-methyltransferase
MYQTLCILSSKGSHIRYNTHMNAHHQPIRSFVRREGNITSGQRRALDTLFIKYAAPAGRFDAVEVFGNDHPVWIEIGFGDGENLAYVAQQKPEVNIIGIEVYRPGVGALLNRLEQEQIHNVRVMVDDAVQRLHADFAEHSIERILLLFPDPWHKTRHHKRRIVNDAFFSLCQRLLIPGGILHVATDWQDYAEHIATTAKKFAKMADVSASASRIRANTKFERRGERLGHGIYDFLFMKHQDNL